MGYELTRSSADKELLPEGSYHATCVSIVDYGTQKQAKGDDKPKVAFGFEIDGEENAEGEPVLLFRKYTAELKPKSHLTLDIQSWQKLKIEKGDVFDLETLAGRTCLLTVVHSDPAKSDSGEVFANIAKISPVMKDKDTGKPTKLAKARTKVTVLFLNKDGFDRDVFDNLVDFVKDEIKKSPEYKALSSKSSRKRDEEEEQEEERPRSRKPAPREEEEDRPAPRGKASRRDEEEEQEEERPRSRRNVHDNDDEEEDEKPTRGFQSRKPTETPKRGR